MLSRFLFALTLFAASVTAFAADWKPAPAPLMTKWGKAGHARERLEGVPAAAAGPQGLAEPQRPVGLRDHREGRREAREVGRADSRALLRRVGALRRRQARRRRIRTSGISRTFEVPAGWKGKRVLLHFGAVDWETTVFVNGKELGTHRGMSDPFSFDITDALKDGQERTGRPRLGSDRRRCAAARQAGLEARRHLVHAGHRHLADGVDGTGERHESHIDHVRPFHSRRRQG